MDELRHLSALTVEITFDDDPPDLISVPGVTAFEVAGPPSAMPGHGIDGSAPEGSCRRGRAASCSAENRRSRSCSSFTTGKPRDT